MLPLDWIPPPPIKNCHCPVGSSPVTPIYFPTGHQPALHSDRSSRALASGGDMELKLLSLCLFLAFFAAEAYAASRAAAAAVTATGTAPLQSDSSDPENQCVYTVYVRTGSIWKGGTDSTIGVTLLGADGTGIRIRDLAAWGGLMGAGHDYYERGNLDIFSGRGPCMRQAPCAMNLTSDGAGAHHGWYCNYLEATVTGPHLGCAQRLFTVEQWLATDTSPYRLYAVVDKCGKTEERRRQETRQSPAGEAEAEEATVTAL